MSTADAAIAALQAKNQLGSRKGWDASDAAEEEGEDEDHLYEQVDGNAANGHDDEHDGSLSTSTKKRKNKKKSKKKRATASQASTGSLADSEAARIKISRNKHMRFISSYHGPWLQLPTEIMETLLELNCDQRGLSAAAAESGLGTVQAETLSNGIHPSVSTLKSNGSPLHRSSRLHSSSAATGLGSESSASRGGSAGVGNDDPLPSPIDPAVLRGTLEVRKLVDAASDLAVRAASGLSAAALGALASSTANSGGSVAAALGLENTINGRSAAMSATRQHRLRAMAVSKLAQAYAIDEVAASVAVMQGATAIDDIAEKVLRQESNNADALLVGFFHEKIPSAPSIARLHAQSAPNVVLENLMLRFPENLHYQRSYGIWQSFKQDYPGAIETYTRALENAQALRRPTKAHSRSAQDRRGGKSVRRRGGGRTSRNNHASGRHSVHDVGGNPVNGVSTIPAGVDDDGQSGEVSGQIRADKRLFTLPADSSSTTANEDIYNSPSAVRPCDEAADIGKIPGDDIERQMIFLRGMAYFQLASAKIEEQVLAIERVDRPVGGLANESGELALSAIGIKTAPGDRAQFKGSIIGSASDEKLLQYQGVFGEASSTDVAAAGRPRDEIVRLLRQSNEDLERFLSYFAIWEAPDNLYTFRVFDEERRGTSTADAMLLRNAVAGIENNHLLRLGNEKTVPFRGRKLIHHRSLTGRNRFGDPRTAKSVPTPPALLTTYHPLIIEAHFSLLLNLLLLGEFETLLSQHYRVSRLMDSLEGYPTFVPARSLNQSQYAEVMELLAMSWLADRETTKGKVPPPLDLPEDQIRGKLACLHHLLGYFTEEHSRRLEVATLRAENDAATLAAELKAKESVGNSNGVMGSNAVNRADLERRLLLEAIGRSSSSSSGNGNATSIDTKPAKRALAIEPAPDAATSSDQTGSATTSTSTARAEVALAWLMVGILPRLEKEEEQEDAGATTSAAAHSKGRHSDIMEPGAQQNNGLNGNSTDEYGLSSLSGLARHMNGDDHIGTSGSSSVAPPSTQITSLSQNRNHLSNGTAAGKSLLHPSSDNIMSDEYARGGGGGGGVSKGKGKAREAGATMLDALSQASLNLWSDIPPSSSLSSGSSFIKGKGKGKERSFD